jgi:hypothetical protein
MNITGYLNEEPATAEYILAVMRDQMRYRNAEGYGDRSTELTFDSSVAEWRKSSLLPGTRRLGRGLGAFFGVDYTDSEWRSLLDPAKERRLLGVCEAIATKGKRRRVRPVRVLGSADCLPAGAFLAIRSLLVEAGADRSKIKPSTRLDQYYDEYDAIFFDQIAALAPGSVPSFSKRNSRDMMAAASIAACFVLFLSTAVALEFVGFHDAKNWLLVICSIVAAMIWEIFEPRREIEGLTTFRDLAIAIGSANDI